MPDIIGGEGGLRDFGIGLAQGAKEPKQLWYQIVEQFEVTPREKRDLRVLCGFLEELGAHQSPLLDELLDAALENEPLGRYFPFLQASVPITPRGMARLGRSIELGKVPVESYSATHLGRAIEVVPAADIAAYITSLALQPQGERVAIHLLSMQFFGDRQDKRAHAAELVDAGRAILRKLNFARRDEREDYHLHAVVEVCASGAEGFAVGQALSRNLKQAAVEHRVLGFGHNHLLKALFKVQPKAVLGALLTGEPKAVAAAVHLIEQAAHLQGNPVDEASEAALFEWCAEDPSHRFPAAAAVVSAFTLTADQKPAAWTPIASRLVHSAPDPLAVMQVFVDRLRPMSWSGSRSTLLQTNAALLAQFDVQNNSGLVAFIDAQKVMLQDEALHELNWETKIFRDRDETFE